MRQIGILVAALITLATAATSEEVTVRSGEHEGYTRLVFSVPPDTGWVLSQRKNGAKLAIDLKGVTFRTGSVFGRLTSDRLAALSQTQPGGALELEFGCDCTASAFLFRSSMIVLDIAPAIALPPLLAEIPPPTRKNPAAPKPAPPEHKLLSQLDLPLLTGKTQGIRDQLSTRLVQGADRELLDLNLAPVGPRRSASSEAVTLLPGLTSNIRVTSVLDDLQDILNSGLQQIDNNPVCISTAELGFTTWPGTRPFPEQVSALRTALYKEFDRLDAESALKLAKLYAYHGFGAEALKVLQLLNTPPDEIGRVEGIARLVDERPAQEPNPFRGQQRCNSDVALWAVLSEGQLAPDAPLEAIEHSFAKLPEHLRRHLGARLSDILTNAQELEAARRIMRSVDRVEQNPSPNATLARAGVAEAEGDSALEEALLTKVTTSAGAKSEAPVALARLVEKRWFDRKTVSSKELELAASYAIEFRRSDLGPMMNRTYAIALGLSQDFDSAIDVIQSLPDGPDSNSAINRHLQLLAERSDDLTFLRQVTLVQQSGHMAALSTDTAIALAERLSVLGFADRAVALTNRPEDQARRSERARLRARAALLSDRPQQAMLELANDTSDEALVLRAQALDKVQNYAAVAELTQSRGQQDEANRYLWLAGLPGERSGPSDGKYAILNQTAEALLAPPVRVSGKPLADAGSLLEDSQATRQRIVEMLNTVRGE
ncbi:hypothetical protein [Ruegeria sp. HKCCSP351]|uniref:hypothetical protein n=1 Tax=Ruegeria sp. HKCCSP351 TaxID=2794832 RepID=UPI001AE5AC11|nr:hypothetical protein [Ruegeria sp. HKCCSP351]